MSINYDYNYHIATYFGSTTAYLTAQMEKIDIIYYIWVSLVVALYCH